MGANHRDAEPRNGHRGGQGCHIKRLSRRARRHARALLHPGTKARDQRVLPGVGQQRHTAGVPIGAGAQSSPTGTSRA